MANCTIQIGADPETSWVLGFHQHRLLVAYSDKPRAIVPYDLVAMPVGMARDLPKQLHAAVARGTFHGLVTLGDQLLQFAVFGIRREV